MFAERLASRSVAGVARERERTRCAVSVDGGSRAESALQRPVVEPAFGRGDLGQPALHRSGSVEPPPVHGLGRTTADEPGGVGDLPSPSHPALVSEADFVAAQPVRTVRRNDDGECRRYLLAGLILGPLQLSSRAERD